MAPQRRTQTHSHTAPLATSPFATGCRSVVYVQARERTVQVGARSLLTESFDRCRYPTPDERRRLAQRTGLTLTQINNWFKNRRQRHKSMQPPHTVASSSLSSSSSSAAAAATTGVTSSQRPASMTSQLQRLPKRSTIFDCTLILFVFCKRKFFFFGVCSNFNKLKTPGQ